MNPDPDPPPRGLRALGGWYVLALLVVVLVHLLLVTYGTLSLRGTERWGSAYDSLGENLLHLDASVDADAIGWESFEIRGERYMYFGPFPALLRIAANAIAPSWRGEWSKTSCLLAALIAVLAVTNLAAYAVGRNPDVTSRSRSLLLLAVIVGTGLGSPVLYLVSCARIYHEAILWGLAWALVSLDVALRLLDGTLSERRGLLALSATTAATLLSRVTFALPFVAILSLLAVRAAVRAFRGPRPVAGLGLLVLALAPAAVGVAGQLAYNAARFGSPFRSIDFTHFYVNPESCGGSFNPRRIPTALANYILPDSAAFSTEMPFLRSVPVTYRDPGLFFGWTEQCVPLAVGSPWLLLAALPGLWLLLKGPSLRRVGPLALLLVLESLLIASYFFVTQRFAAEFLPLLTLLTATLLAQGRFERWPERLLPGILIMLAVLSAATTLTSTLHWNMAFNGDAPTEWRARLGHLLTPGLPLAPWPGPRLSLTELPPAAEQADFVSLHRNATVAGEPIFIRNHHYVSGIGMHATATATWRIPEGAVAFQAVAGLPDSTSHCRSASVVLSVTGGSGRILFQSGVVRAGDAPVPVHANLRGETELTLNVDDAGDGRDCDHGTWGDAAFLIGAEPVDVTGVPEASHAFR